MTAIEMVHVCSRGHEWRLVHLMARGVPLILSSLHCCFAYHPASGGGCSAARGTNARSAARTWHDLWCCIGHSCTGARYAAHYSVTVSSGCCCNGASLPTIRPSVCCISRRRHHWWQRFDAFPASRMSRPIGIRPIVPSARILCIFLIRMRCLTLCSVAMCWNISPPIRRPCANYGACCARAVLPLF